jgi:TonB family protein
MRHQTAPHPIQSDSSLPESGMGRSTARSALGGALRLSFRATILALLPAVLAATAQAQENRKALSAPPPAYPPLAKQLQLKGTVKIQIVIAKDGTVQDASVIGGHPLLVEPALEAVKRWKYERAATETTALVQFNFHP